MKYKIILYISFIGLLSACELITLGAKHRQPVIQLNQESAIGAVYLFKSELDSNNIHGAIRILSKPNGNTYLAYEKYELYDELSRLKRIIGMKPITWTKADTINDKLSKIRLEFDYLKAYSFSTAKINDKWYILEYTELAAGK